MLCQRLRVRLRPELVQQPRRPLDVSEQEGDGRARELAPHARMIAARGSLVHGQPLPTKAAAAWRTSSAVHGPPPGGELTRPDSRTVRGHSRTLAQPMLA